MKINIINTLAEDQITEQKKLSKPSRYNYDVQGITNPLTSSLALRVRNVPKNMRNKDYMTIVLINIESAYYANDKKVKINASPIMNNISRMKPEQKKYYFSEISNLRSIKEKAVYTLKNKEKENDLMIIEISSCKGDFLYALTDFPPLDNDNYHYLKEKSVPSEIYSSNGKKIITVRNLQVKEYFLILFAANEENFDIILDNKNISNNNNNVNNRKYSEIDVLFYYYTINEKNFNYLVTQDSLKFESPDDFYSIILFLPETKRRDIFGRENKEQNMNYFFIITDEKRHFDYMESTCYLTKLQQKNNNDKYKLEIIFDEKNKIFKIKGLEGGKEYYMNILAKNKNTGEVITYKPVKVVSSVASRRLKAFLIVFLVIIFIVFLYMAFTVYRKYRIKKIELNYVEDQNRMSPKNQNKKIGKLKNINLDFVKKKYNQLGEDSQELNA